MYFMYENLIRKIFRRLSIFGLRASYCSRPTRIDSYFQGLSDRHFENALDIGSGPSPRNPFLSKLAYGVDIRSYDKGTARVLKCNLAGDPLPFPDSYFDCVTAFDVLEHIPRVLNLNGEQVYPFVQMMNEIWRVLRKDGYFFSQTPCFPMKEAFQDPTHVNIMTEDTLSLYFCDKAWARIYGFEGSFSLVEEGWSGSHYWAVIQKTTDQRVVDRDSPQRH
jgi:SAM-dependent methyltransferase